MRRVVILGAGGFIGRSLAAGLVRTPEHALVLVGRRREALPEALEGDRVTLVEADFEDTERVAGICRDCDVVLNLVSGSTPRFTPTGAQGEARANVLPQIAFLEQMAEHSRARIVFFSSGGAVYGNPPRLPADEATPTSPISLYGMSKLTVEKHLELFRAIKGLDYTILRLGNVYGPGQSVKLRQGVVPAIFDCILQQRRFTLVGDGRGLRDYVFIDDVVDAVERVVRSPDVGGTILNIASGEGHSVLDILAAVSACSGVELEIEHIDASPQEVADIVLDVGRAAETIGWRPRTSLGEGIAGTWRHLMAEREAGAAGPKRAGAAAAAGKRRAG